MQPDKEGGGSGAVGVAPAHRGRGHAGVKVSSALLLFL